MFWNSPSRLHVRANTRHPAVTGIRHRWLHVQPGSANTVSLSDQERRTQQAHPAFSPHNAVAEDTLRWVRAIHKLYDSLERIHPTTFAPNVSCMQYRDPCIKTSADERLAQNSEARSAESDRRAKQLWVPPESFLATRDGPLCPAVLLCWWGVGVRRGLCKATCLVRTNVASAECWT